MRIADAQWIPAPQHQTWEALTDPEVLCRCIPGCVQMERRSPTEYVLTLRAKVGDIGADYEGEILLSDLDPPHGCILVFEGRQQTAGLVVGTAQIRLSTKDDGTRLSYAVVAMAGGKLGQLGEAALLKVGEKIVEKFFSAFVDHMAAQPRVAPPAAPPEPKPGGLVNSHWSWAWAALIVLIFFCYYAFK
jgi:carbon monoxide dehydrogenase subunit G